MGKIRQTAVGAGDAAVILAARGKSYLRSIERMPNFFNNPILDRAYKDSLAHKTIVYPDGSVLKTCRGMNPSSRAYVPAPNIVAIGTQFYVCLDAWDVDTGTGDGTYSGILVSKVEDLLNWELITGTIEAEIPTLPSFCDVSASIMYSDMGVKIEGDTLFEVFPQNRDTERNPIVRKVTPYYWWTDYVAPATAWNEKKTPMIDPVGGGDEAQSWSVWSALVGGVELIPSYNYVWDYAVDYPSETLATMAGSMVLNNYHVIHNGTLLPGGGSVDIGYALIGWRSDGNEPFSAGVLSGSTAGFRRSSPGLASNGYKYTNIPTRDSDFFVQINGTYHNVDTSVAVLGYGNDDTTVKSGKYYYNDLVDQWYVVFSKTRNTLTINDLAEYTSSGTKDFSVGIVAEDGTIKHEYIPITGSEWFSGTLGYKKGFGIEVGSAVYYTTGLQTRLAVTSPAGSSNRVLGG